MIISRIADAREVATGLPVNQQQIQHQQAIHLLGGMQQVVARLLRKHSKHVNVLAVLNRSVNEELVDQMALLLEHELEDRVSIMSQREIIFFYTCEAVIICGVFPCFFLFVL
jgi:dihydroxyacid dehydratase/phosphogluconate dehydratase